MYTCFLGIPLEFFDGIIDALDFFPRCGGTKKAERMPFNEDLEDRRYTRQEIERALAAVGVPESCIRKWMMDTGCGCDLVSVSAIAKLLDYIITCQGGQNFFNSKWFNDS